MRRGLNRLMLLGAAAGAVVAGGSAFAYTASNTVPTSYAGSGSGTVSGYTASGITYGLGTEQSDGSTPITSVKFTLSQAATNVDAFLSGATGTPVEYASCTNGGSGNIWTCSSAVTPAVDQTLLNASGLVVNASQ